MITGSPVSRLGAKVALCLPRRIVATCVARRPSVAPSASTTRHARCTSLAFGAYVFTFLLLLFLAVRLRPLRVVASLPLRSLLNSFVAGQPLLTRPLLRDASSVVVDRTRPGSDTALAPERWDPPAPGRAIGGPPRIDRRRSCLDRPTGASRRSRAPYRGGTRPLR